MTRDTLAALIHAAVHGEACTLPPSEQHYTIADYLLAWRESVRERRDEYFKAMKLAYEGEPLPSSVVCAHCSRCGNDEWHCTCLLAPSAAAVEAAAIAARLREIGAAASLGAEMRIHGAPISTYNVYHWAAKQVEDAESALRAAREEK